MWVGPISSCLPGGGQFAVAYRRRGAFCKGIVSTARRGGLSFAPAKGSKTGQRGTGLPPLQTPLTLSCAGYGFRFFWGEKSKSVLHADGLQRCLRHIFIAAALERRTANHHPCPLLGGGGLWGRKTNTLRSAAWLSASPNAPRVLLSVYSCQPIRAPFPPSGKGVGGKGRYARGYLGSDSVRSTD